MLDAPGVTPRLPDVATVPDQAPEAAHAEALVAAQVSVLPFPAVTVVGLADKVMVGSCADTAVVATLTDDTGDEPPAFEHVSE